MKDMEKEKFIENRGEIVLYQPDANITMEVRLDATFDTVWLNRQQMAELFERDVKTIGKHIKMPYRKNLQWIQLAQKMRQLRKGQKIQLSQNLR